MADPYVGAARALVGQGLGMGWGDEAEAWLRSKLGNEKYEKALPRIRQEYAQYAKESPFTSGALEFAGGVAPGVAAMMIPGGQAAGAAQIQRSTASTLARMAGLGALSGGVAGAGGAEEGKRVSGGGVGAVLGGALGVGAPVALRGGSAAARWLQERLAPSSATIADRAAGKFSGAMAQEKMTPADITAQMAKDRAMGVPSVVANVNPALAELAEAVAQRTGAGARKVEKTLTEQKLGSRERSHQQVVKGLQPGEYYADLGKLQDELKTKAAPYYQQAYAHGEVTDPEVLKFMQLPQFQEGLGQAKKLLAAEGRALPMTKSIDPITGQEVEKIAPTVEMLDQVKRGLDTLIEAQTDAVTGKVTSLGRVYVAKKNEFLNALDKAVPEYGQARSVYKGDAELADAMRSGINDFKKMDHEQVIKLVAGMSGAEKEAFRTGVARDLYGKIMDPSGNFNSAQRIIGSPETKSKLQPLFDTPGQYDLFKNAMEREAQLFHQSNQILGGSQTGKRMQMREQLEQEPGLTNAVAQAMTGGFWSSLTGLAAGAVRKGGMTEEVSTKLSNMLMSKDPSEVAAVVKLLEEYNAKSAPKALRAGAAEAGTVTGTTAAMQPSPQVKGSEANIEQEMSNQPAMPAGADIEAEIEADLRAQQPQQYEPPPRVPVQVEGFGEPATLR